MDGGCCRVRAWCKRETRQAAMQLVLLCLACCSWTLLLISLTLTTTSTTHRHVVEVVEVPGPGWKGGSAGACEECLTRRGPPGTYWRVFQQPLQQVVSALNHLDQPLAAPALRTHLLGARALLRHLATVLHLPLTTTTNGDPDIKESEAVILPAPGKPHERLACQERFLGSKVGYPRYLKGFMRVNCTATPIQQAVTAVLWDVKSEHLPGLLNDFERVYPDLLLLLVAANSPPTPTHVAVKPPTPSLSHALAHLLKQVTTPYVLLAPRLAHLSHHSRLERLVWAAEWTGVWAVSGSVRGEDGRWRPGCLQVREGEGQLVYSRGYQTSLYECQLCQGVEGPVLVQTTALKSLAWPAPTLHPHLLLPHLLLQIHTRAPPHQHGAATCPDAMFLVTDLEPPWQQKPTPPLLQERELRRVAALWRPLARRRHLARLYLPSSLTINYPCDFLEAARPAHATQYFPTAADSNITAARACEGKEVQAMLSAILQACDVTGNRCFLLEPPMADVIGGDLRDLLGRNISLGINSTQLPPIITANLSNYAPVSEGGHVRVKGRWWAVTVMPTVPDHQIRWSKVEVVPGVWMWGQLPPDVGKGVERGEGGFLPVFHALEATLEEDMRSLAAPRCAQGRSTHITLRSP